VNKKRYEWLKRRYERLKRRYKYEATSGSKRVLALLARK